MKSVIITGANQGIGYSMVKQLLADGCQISVLDLEIENLEKLQREHKGRLLLFKCDVKNESAMVEAISESVKKFGGVDIAVHNACRCSFESMEATDYSVYEDIMDINYFGALRMTRAVIPFMNKAGKGKIIYTSSGVGVMGFVNISPYASSKGAIEVLSKCMNIEYQDKGITFHLFHPPLTQTKSASGLPMPKEFMADPIKVGTGLAKRIDSKNYIICHSFGQKVQVMACYLFPIKIGKLMSKMTAKYIQGELPH